MKFPNLSFIASILLILMLGLIISARAADATPTQGHRFEYVTIHWDGRDNTHIILSNGDVKSLGSQLTKISKPNRTDERAFYMNIAINSLAKEGYEFVGIRDNDVIMKRIATP